MSWASRVAALPGLVGWWRLGETAGTAADNAEGTAAKDGTYTGGYTLNQTSLIANDTDPGVLLTASGAGYVTVANHADWHIATTGKLTVGVWAKRATLADVGVLVGKGGAGGSGYEWDMEQLASSGTMRFQLRQGGGTTVTQVDSAATGAGTHFYVMTVDTTSSILAAYIDAAKVGHGGAWSGSLGSSTDALDIGRRNDAVWYFNDVVDEVFITNTVLSPDTIQELYSAGTAALLTGRYLLESGSPDGYLLEDSSGVLVGEDATDTVTGTLDGTSGGQTASFTASESIPGTLAGTSGGQTGAFTGLVAAPVTGTWASDSPTQAASFTGALTITGTFAGSAPTPSSSWTAAEAFTGTLASTTPGQESAFSGMVVVNATGTLAGTAPGQESSFTGTMVEAITGTFASTAPGPASDLTGLETITGALAGSPSPASAAFTGSESIPGVLGGTSPSPSSSWTGTHVYTITGTFDSTTPTPESAFVGVFTQNAEGTFASIAPGPFAEFLGPEFDWERQLGYVTVDASVGSITVSEPAMALVTVDALLQGSATTDDEPAGSITLEPELAGVAS